MGIQITNKTPLPLIGRVAEPALCVVQAEAVAMELAECLFENYYRHTVHHRLLPHTAFVIITDTGRGWVLSWPGYTCTAAHRHAARIEIVRWARERGYAGAWVSPPTI